VYLTFPFVDYNWRYFLKWEEHIQKNAICFFFDYIILKPSDKDGSSSRFVWIYVCSLKQIYLFIFILSGRSIHFKQIDEFILL